MFKCCYLDFVYCDFDVDYLVFENQISFSCHLFLSANVRHISGVEIFISILNGVLKIEDVLEFAKFMDSSGILLALDFDQEFNSLNHSFLLKVL